MLEMLEFVLVVMLGTLAIGFIAALAAVIVITYRDLFR